MLATLLRSYQFLNEGVEVINSSLFINNVTCWPHIVLIWRHWLRYFLTYPSHCLKDKFRWLIFLLSSSCLNKTGKGGWKGPQLTAMMKTAYKISCVDPFTKCRSVPEAWLHAWGCCRLQKCSVAKCGSHDSQERKWQQLEKAGRAGWKGALLERWMGEMKRGTPDSGKGSPKLRKHQSTWPPFLHMGNARGMKTRSICLSLWRATNFMLGKHCSSTGLWVMGYKL